MIDDRETLATSSHRELALSCVEAGIEAAHPETVLAEHVEYDGQYLMVNGDSYDLDDYEDVVVLGGGNAAGHVAVILEEKLGDRLSGGVVVTDDPAETTRITIREGDHPVPSERGAEGAREVLDRAENAGEETLVLAVITGGGSALLPAPAGDVSLEQLQSVTNELLASGATIHEINAVRKHLSAIKGGRLAAATTPATVVGLVFSDVVGNDLDVIASGPLSPDSTTFEDALDVLERYDLSVPDPVRTRLKRGAAGEIEETPSTGDSAFDHVSTHVVADGMTALAAARDVARERGYETQILSSRVRGEAREAAKTHVAIAEEAVATGNPVESPAVLLSGGETTVTIRGDGQGGPNQEFALSSAIELDEENIVVASVDTDGIDGATDVAGAIVDAKTAPSPASDAKRALASNDAYPYLDAADALIETGPTGTNVNDLRVIVIDG